MVYRYLRNLEGVSPPLSLTHLACQTTAKAFTATRQSTLLFHFILFFSLFFCFEHFSPPPPLTSQAP